MYPVLFELGSFPLRSFGVMVAIAFLVGAHIWGKLMGRFGQDPLGDPDRVSNVTMAVLVGVLAGGRLFYVIVEILRYLASRDQASVGASYIADPLSIFFIWQGGLVMYGGFIGAIVMGLRSSRKHGLHPFNALDTALVAGFFGQAIGRVGCLLVGDDYGSVVPEAYRDLPFPIVLQVPSLEWLQANPQSLFPDHLAGEYLWATQPWMTVNALVIGFVSLWMLRRRRYMGQVSLIIFVHYAITRFAIEAFRGDEIRGVWFGGLSTSQLISLVGGTAALVLLVRLRGVREPVPGSPVSADDAL
ncbi:MAG: prolipoprotein diacylglyceryl transferase [Planctomycetota bacterium]|nr:prolipoprotein diacylglyceryl transferase [Planctomycetota bacterium]